jgi:molybdate transport system regulatory protein
MSNPAGIVGIRLRVDVSPDCSIGPGKVALLEQIERSGSLSQAARILKMSYRRAWLLLEDLNRTLGQPVTTANVGGAGGGGAHITPFGRQVVTAFREIERAATGAAGQQLAWLMQSRPATHGAPVAPRRAVTRSLTRTGEPTGAATPPEDSRPRKRGRAAKRS